MSRIIEYTFSLASPWAYIGFELFHSIARKHGVSIRYRPVMLGEVFAETGGQPLSKRHPVRQAYRIVELQRWRAFRKVPLNLRPRFWPFENALADRAAIAIMETGHSPESYLRAAHRAIWFEDQNLADENVVSGMLAACNHDPACIERAKSEGVRETYAANRDWAIENGAFGAPGYMLDGEFFWGQDRLELLDLALASGRPPFRADATD